MKTNVFTIIGGFIVVALLSACSINLGQGNGANLTGVTGSGNVVTSTRSVSGFDGVSMNGAGRVLIDQNGSESLTITTDDNLLQYITTEVRGGKLYIDFKPGVMFTKFKDLTFTIGAKNLNAIDLNGAAQVEGKTIATEHLSVTMNGAGTITLSGRATAQDVSLGGFGKYDGSNLESKNANVRQDGAGSAVVRVSDTLKATINGVGSIEYIGNPQVTKSANGLGSIRQRQ